MEIGALSFAFYGNYVHFTRFFIDIMQLPCSVVGDI